MASIKEKAEEIYGINGPVVYIDGPTLFQMQEMVYVGHERLIGEVIRINNERTTIQVYEETAGLKPGEPVVGTGSLLSIELGPGILNNIFDGIERPLTEIAKLSGQYIERGANVANLNADKEWAVTFLLSEGSEVKAGSIIAETPETTAITHKVMIPPNVQGKLVNVKKDGNYRIHDVLAQVEKYNGDLIDITMSQRWPIRTPRPASKRFPSTEPLVTGQRILDTFFPIAKGGTAAIPGGFGTGKTSLQHQIAKFANADIIIYIGCGERGNEMTDVLESFSELIDPHTGRPLMERTALIANTSNMPVSAREASIYTGVTLAEYYRDMGYDVAVMADSTSRWAEALRELSGRLEEMPAEEGFPAYLASRIASFYERAGFMENLNGTQGSISIIGAVSPQGGDFSEPVTQNTKRFVRCFWGLDSGLAHERHYPAVDWLDSYSNYLKDLTPWYRENVDDQFIQYRNELTAILSKEAELMEVVKLIGADVLPDDQKLVIQIGRVIRLGFLQQNAFHPEDTNVPLEKQFKMMEIILKLYDESKKLIAMNMPMSLLSKDSIWSKVINIKYDVANNELNKLDDYLADIDRYYQYFIETNA